MLQPYDQIFVRLNPNFHPVRNVVISGEVKYPGTYSIIRKTEKISSLIDRAGGLTDYAYLDGAKMFRRFHNSEKESTSLGSLKYSLDSLSMITNIEKKLNEMAYKKHEYIDILISN